MKRLYHFEEGISEENEEAPSDNTINREDSNDVEKDQHHYHIKKEENKNRKTSLVTGLID